MTINIYYFICVASMVMCGGTFLGLCMEQLVPVRETSASARRRIFYWTLFPAIFMLIKGAVMNSENAAIVMSAATLAYTVGCILMIWKYYGGKRFEKYSMFAALLFMTVAGDMTFGMLYQLIAGKALEVPAYNTPSAALGCAGAALIGSIYMVLIVWFVNRKKQGGRLYVPVLMVLLAVFVCAGIAAGPATSGESGLYDATFIFVAACCIVFLYLCLCIFFVSEQNRNTKREQEEFLRALETEQMRYQALEERREELAKLRHDYRNLLTTVGLLLESGETEKARELLADLSQRAGAAKEGPRSDHAADETAGKNHSSVWRHDESVYDRLSEILKQR